MQTSSLKHSVGELTTENEVLVSAPLLLNVSATSRNKSKATKTENSHA